MTKADAIAALAEIPDDELVFVVRGSHPAAPETVREFGRRVLHAARWGARAGTPELIEQSRRAASEARVLADRAFAMADLMEQQQRRAGPMPGEHVARGPDPAAAVAEPQSKPVTTDKPPDQPTARAPRTSAKRQPVKRKKR
jgi:hypothetical protein